MMTVNVRVLSIKIHIRCNVSWHVHKNGLAHFYILYIT